MPLSYQIAWAGQRSRYSDWLRAGRSRDRIPVEARFSAPVQTGPGAHPASCTKGTGSFPGVKSGRGVTLITHTLLVPWPLKGRAILLLPYGPYGLYRGSVPVQRCTFTRLPIIFQELWLKTGTLFSHLDLFLTFFPCHAFHYHLLFSYLESDRPTVLLLQNPLFRSCALHAL